MGDQGVPESTRLSYSMASCRKPSDPRKSTIALTLASPHGGMRIHNRMRFGAEAQNGGVRFRLWAPKHAHVALKIEGDEKAHPMRAEADGWHSLLTDAAQAGSRYRFVLPDGMTIPDPASRFQPLDVHGPSEVIDPSAYDWHDADWRGREWEDAVLYELHIGAFTREGTFCAAIEKLDALGRTRRHRDRANAGRGFPGQTQLGLRRRAALRAGFKLRPPGRPEGARSTPPTAAG